MISPVVAPRRADWRVPTVTIAVAALGLGFNLLRIAWGLDHGSLALSMAAFTGLGAVAVALAFGLRLRPSELGLTRPGGVALAGVVVAATVLAGAALLNRPVVHLPALPSLVAGLALFGLFTAPAEELLFRGVLYGVVARIAGPVAAVALSSLAFALVHVPVYGFASLPLALTAGAILGWLRWWSGSLAAPAAVHVVADLALLWL